METKLIVEPRDSLLKALDARIEESISNLQQQIEDSLERLGYSMFDGPTYSFAIIQAEPADSRDVSPFRTIRANGLRGFSEVDSILTKLGFIDLNKGSFSPMAGFDGVYLLQNP